MKKEVISGRQGISMLFFMFASMTIINVTMAGDVNQDVWISVIMAGISVVPLFLMYYRLNMLFPDHNFFDILEIVFGKAVGKITTVIFIVYGIHSASLVISYMADFLQAGTMPQTKLFFITIFIALVCIIALKCGIEVIARCAQLFFWIVLFSMLIEILLSLGKIDLGRLTPVLFDGWKPVFNGAFVISMLPLGQVVFFSVVMHHIKPTHRLHKVMFISEAIYIVLYILLIVKNISVLGMVNFKLLLYPSFTAASLINVGGFLQSVEIFVALYYFITAIFLVIITVFFASKGVQKLFNLKNYREITTPMVLITVALAFTLFEDYGDTGYFLAIYSHYMVPFQVVLPTITYVLAEIKAKKLRNKAAKPMAS